MNKSEKASFVVQKLEEIYPEVPVPLDHHSPYTLLVGSCVIVCAVHRRTGK